MDASLSAETIIADARSCFRGRVLCAAVRLGIAGHLDQPRTLTELAALTDAREPSLFRLLRALAAIDIVEEQPQARFALTEHGALLRRDHPSSTWASVVFWADLLADSWSYLPECIRTGDPSWVVAQRAGTTREQAPDHWEIFHGAMAAGGGEREHRPFVEAYDFGGAAAVADLGGGAGGLLTAILQAHAGIRGVLVEFPRALEGAKRRLAEAGVADRCDFVEHDLLDSVPVAADVYILKHVLHACDDAEAGRILDNCRKAMPTDSRLLVIETALPNADVAVGPDAESALMSDLNMLVVTGGRERDESDWRALLQRSALQVVRFVPVAGLSGPETIVDSGRLFFISNLSFCLFADRLNRRRTSPRRSVA